VEVYSAAVGVYRVFQQNRKRSYVVINTLHHFAG
jgi:hypothetical protein